MEQTPTTPSASSHKKIGISIALAVIIIVAVIIAFSMKGSGSNMAPSTTADDTTTTSVATSSAATTSTSTSTTTVASSPYKDGTYTATGSYMSPGGADKIGVTLTIKNGVVTDASVAPMPGDHMSQRYQTMFASGYTTYVVGKNLSDLNVGKVSGSSLTPQGFNDAVAQIRAQAQA